MQSRIDHGKYDKGNNTAWIIIVFVPSPCQNPFISSIQVSLQD